MDKDVLKLLNKDKLLKKAIKSVGNLPETFRMTGEVYFDLVRSIAFQQIHGAAARKIFGRFLDLFDDGYPRPGQVLELDISDLRSVGFSKQKGSYIQNIATFALEEKLHLIDWKNKTDEEIIEYLTQIKGVGKWTVQMVLMGGLDRLDVFPVADFGIQQAMIKLYNIDPALKGKKLALEMEAIGEKWKPYRSVASRYLWKWVDGVS